MPALDTLGIGEQARQLGRSQVRGAFLRPDGSRIAPINVLFGAAFAARYTGSTAWRGTVDGDIDSVTETRGEGSLFGITPRDGGRTNWFASSLQPEGARSSEGEVGVLRARFGHWHEVVRHVLAGLDEAAVLRHDLYYLDPPLPSYVQATWL